MNYRKQPERRTFLQDRFDILIKRQQTGEATFNELTELDDIVNRDPELREKVIRESMLIQGTDDANGPLNNPGEDPYLPSIMQKGLLARVREILSRIFVSKISVIKSKMINFYPIKAVLM